MFSFLNRNKQRIKAHVSSEAVVLSAKGGSGDPYMVRIEMARLSAATLELKETESGPALVLSRPEGTTETVGTFADRDAAAAVLHAVTEALSKGGRSKSSCGIVCGFLRAILWALALVGFIALLVVAWPRSDANVYAPAAQQQSQNFVAPSAPPSSAPAASQAPRAVVPGEPVPADQLFAD